MIMRPRRAYGSVLAYGGVAGPGTPAGSSATASLSLAGLGPVGPPDQGLTVVVCVMAYHTVAGRLVSSLGATLGSANLQFINRTPADGLTCCGMFVVDPTDLPTLGGGTKTVSVSFSAAVTVVRFQLFGLLDMRTDAGSAGLVASSAVAATSSSATTINSSAFSQTPNGAVIGCAANSGGQAATSCTAGYTLSGGGSAGSLGFGCYFASAVGEAASTSCTVTWAATAPDRTNMAAAFR